jgi:hypothetical protein
MAARDANVGTPILPFRRMCRPKHEAPGRIRALVELSCASSCDEHLP